MKYSNDEKKELMRAANSSENLISDEENFWASMYDEKEELVRGANSLKENVENLNSEILYDAIMKSFATDHGDTSLPPKNQCYLSINSIVFLRKLGLKIDEDVFVGPLMASPCNLKHIIEAMMSQSLVRSDCAMLLSRLLNKTESPPHLLIEEMIKLNAVPNLIRLLGSNDETICDETPQKEALSSLVWIARNGSTTHLEIMIKGGAIQSLLNILHTSPSYYVALCAGRALHEFVVAHNMNHLSLIRKEALTIMEPQLKLQRKR